MNLVIDVGNTLVKWGVFESGKSIFKRVFGKDDFLKELAAVSATYPSIQQTIVSSVGKLSEEQVEQLMQQFEVITLDQQTAIPFTNRYSTPETLGVDRIALVSAAAKEFPDKNVLIIDAGTAITYDFLSASNEFLGGAISPGVSMRYKSLHNYTAKLPLLEANFPKSWIGDSTTESLHSGVLNGILFEMDGFIEAYKNKFDNLTVILTGGDAHFLRDRIKNDIFANSNFLLEGLNHILEYNIR